jgi:hypothetical protein
MPDTPPCPAQAIPTRPRTVAVAKRTKLLGTGSSLVWRSALRLHTARCRYVCSRQHTQPPHAHVTRTSQGSCPEACKAELLAGGRLPCCEATATQLTDVPFPRCLPSAAPALPSPAPRLVTLAVTQAATASFIYACMYNVVLLVLCWPRPQMFVHIVAYKAGRPYTVHAAIGEANGRVGSISVVRRVASMARERAIPVELAGAASWGRTESLGLGCMAQDPCGTSGTGCVLWRST